MATIATPTAQPIALAIPTTLAVAAHPSVQEISVTANPIKPPQRPPTTIARTESNRAISGGAAFEGLFSNGMELSGATFELYLLEIDVTLVGFL